MPRAKGAAVVEFAGYDWYRKPFFEENHWEAYVRLKLLNGFTFDVKVATEKGGEEADMKFATAVAGFIGSFHPGLVRQDYSSSLDPEDQRGE